MAESYDDSGDPAGWSDPGGTGFNEIIDAGDPNAEASPITLDYYRQKALQLQSLLNGFDTVYFDLQGMAAIASNLDDGGAMLNEINGLLGDFEDKRSQLVNTAQALNLASDGLNAVGVEFPQVNVPGMAGVPLAAVAVVAGVIGAAVVLISWGNRAFALAGDIARRMQQADVIAKLPESERANAVQTAINAERNIELERAKINDSPLAGAASLLKWALIAAVAYFGYKAWKEQR